MSLEESIKILYNREGNNIHSRYFECIPIEGVELLPERYYICNVVNNQLVTPLNNLPLSYNTSYVYIYSLGYESTKSFSSVANGIMHSIAYTYYRESLAKVHIENFGDIYVGKGAIMDYNFKPLMMSFDIYDKKFTTANGIIWDLNHTVVNFDKEVFINTDNPLCKCIRTKIFPLIVSQERRYIDKIVPIKIEISDISNKIVKSKLFMSASTSADINEYVAKNYK